MGYKRIAEDAARSLRAVLPSAQIDLFSDCPCSNPVFDQVHIIAGDTHRPKFKALCDSRFDRTIYLDAYLRVLADISDIFDVLERFDIAMVQDQYRNNVNSLKTWRLPMSNCFPQLNSGVIAIRKTEKTRQLMQDVDHALRSENLHHDQPIIRVLLYQSDLHICVLPPEYNLMAHRLVEAWDHYHCAPRVLHRSDFHYHISRGIRPIRSISAAIGMAEHRHIRDLLRADRYLNKTPVGKPTRLIDQGVLGYLSYAFYWLGTKIPQLKDHLSSRFRHREKPK